MKKLIAFLLVVYISMQSTPLFISNIIFYVSTFLLIAFLVLQKNPIIERRNYYLQFSFFWLLYGFISVIWSKEYYLWFRNNVILLILLVSIYIFIYIIDSRAMIVWVSNVWGYVLLFANAAGWYEALFNEYYFTTSEYIKTYAKSNKPLFTFYNVNDYAVYLAISIPIVLLSINAASSYRRKVLGYILVASTLILLIYTNSRGSLLALAVGLLSTYLIFKMRMTKKNLISLSLVIVAAFTMLLLAYKNGYIDKFLMKFVHSSSQSDSTRMKLIMNGIEYLKNSNFIGVGSGNVEYWLENLVYYRAGGFKNIHNWWAEVLVNFGIIVFLGYLIFWMKVLFFNIKLGLLYNNKIAKYLTMSVIVFSLAVISPSSILLMKWLPVFTGFVVASTVLLKKEFSLYRKNKLQLV